MRIAHSMIALYMLAGMAASVNAVSAQAVSEPIVSGPAAAAVKAAPRPTIVKAPLAFTANAGQAAPNVEYTASGSNYNMALSQGSVMLALSPARSKAGQANGSHPPAPEFLRMRLDGAASEVHGKPEAELPGKSNFMIGSDRSKWHTDVAMYGRVRYSAVYPGVDLTYYGNQQQLEYDFLVAPHADASRITLGFDGAKPSLAADGDLVLTAPGGRQVRFEKPVVYQALPDGSRQSVAGAFSLARSGKVGFSVGAYDHSRTLVIDPVLSYGSFIGGNEYDQVLGSAVSPQGYFYVTGYTSYYQNSGAVLYPTTKGSLAPNCNWCLYGQNSAFVSKFSADGTTLIYSTFLEGAYQSNPTYGQYPGSTVGNAIAVSADDEAYVFGTTFDSDFPLVNPIQSVCRPDSTGKNQGCQVVYGGETSGGASFFISRLNSTGTALLYSTFFGYGSGGYPTSIALDQNKNILVSGSAYACYGQYCSQINLPITANAYQASFTTSQAVPFVTEISASGQSYLYSTWLGGNTFCGSGNGSCQSYPGQAALVNGLIYVTGSTEAGDLPTTSNAYQRTCTLNGSGAAQCNEMNGYLAIFNPSASTGGASAKVVTYVHGPTSGSDVFLQGVAVDGSGNVFLSGDTTDTSFPVTTTNGFAYGYYSGVANLIVKMSAEGTSMLKSAYVGGPSGENFASFVTTDSQSNVYSEFENGNAPGDVFPLVNAVQSTNKDQDIQLVEESNDLSKVEFSTYMGGSATLTSAGIGLDAERNLYAAAETAYQGSDFVTTTGAFEADYPGGEQKGVVEKISGLYAQSTITLGLSPEPLSAGETVTLTIKVTGASGTPTGTVAIYGDGVMLGALPLSDGTASLQVSGGILGYGEHTVTATYLGNSTYGGSTTSLSGDVSAIGTATTLIVSNTTGYAGSTVTATASVERLAGSGAPGGTVQFRVNGENVGSATLSNGQGSIVVNTAGLPAGTYPVSAVYLGDSVDSGSTSSTVTFTLKGAAGIATGTTVKETPTPIEPEQNLNLSATVVAKSGSGVPTGTVTFYENGGYFLTTATLNASGQATAVRQEVGPPGSYTIYGVYSGDANYAPSTSATISYVISTPPGTATTTSVTASASSVTTGQSFSVAATVKASSGATPAGTVYFYASEAVNYGQSLTLGSATLTNGTATLPVSGISVPGSYAIYAAYFPSGSDAPSVSGYTQLNVVK